MSLVAVEGLAVASRERRLVDGVSFTLDRGETLAIVGESGSGKTLTALSLLQLLPHGFSNPQGRVTIEGTSVIGASARTLRCLRGGQAGMVFQEPMTSLNPLHPIGRQIAEAVRLHRPLSGAALRARVVALLAQAGFADCNARLRAFPHQLSGGQRQRVMIAMALANDPALLIADEPTTALDVTIQAQILDLLDRLKAERGLGLLLVTHDLGIVRRHAQRVLVMKDGRVVEQGAVGRLFAAPAHPYTQRLIRATPRPGIQLHDLLAHAPATPPAAAPPPGDVLLSVEGLVKEFPRKADWMAKLRGHAPAPFRAVDGINFTLRRGETLGLVGESGCGKSTTSMMIMRLLDPTAGRIVFNGVEISAMPAHGFAGHELRRRIQLVFQDPTDSLNPRFTAGRAIAEPLLRLGGPMPRDAVAARCEELARLVGLPTDLLSRFPHQLSGGQKARVGIARAIALDPDLVVLDEPTAALDVSVQAVVLNLLEELKARLGMSYLFVSHDLHVVRLLCNRAIVMQAGRIIEQGDVAEVLEDPKTDYTRKLLAALPHPPV